MDLVQQLAALITVTSAGLYFVTVLVKTYKMFKTNEEEIKTEAKEVVQQVVQQAEQIKVGVEKKVEEIQTKKELTPVSDEQPPVTPPPAQS